MIEKRCRRTQFYTVYVYYCIQYRNYSGCQVHGSKFKGSDLVYRNKLNIEQGIMNFEVKYSTIFNI